MYNIDLNPHFSATDLKIAPEAILKRLDYSHQEPDDYFLSTIKSCISIAKELLSPEVTIAIHKIDELDLSNGILSVKNKEFNIYKIIASQLKDSKEIAFFACSNGKMLERHFDSFFQKGDMLEGYIYSLVGSEAAECLAELTHQYIGQLAKAQGLSITNRFSPGYCRWNVAEQHLLFDMFPPLSTSIKLTDSALMDPIKSVSGIIGIGPNVVKREYQCKACTEDKCLYRDKK